jgi:His-Xaa-Ser repeat protein HxsA
MRKSLTLAGAALSALHGTAQANDQAAENASLTTLALHDGFFAVALSAPLNGGVRNMYASHASHSSHASHASHSSGSSGVYRTPSDDTSTYTPAYTPAYTTPATTPATTPTTSTVSPGIRPLLSPSTARPSADQLKMMIMRVQAALYAKGYDPGAIDGVLSEMTKRALGKFQTAHGLPATYSMTTGTLNALGVALN